ncbi:PREDICTED: uncharacterized protein LOC109221904 [Nicotiana attenuata]|uniref:Uncharacterized protein n=1 Tax=Nicotiana attenuata TaxID=49451 RepID=A0A1J6JMR6_NICAT|nr:PREDICTED: uncharacterized protein LOC109221904 [Nicotiana attenuata]OIT19077.1 hypothetical protein A4A49_42509 [Nicotiana attenuata]
MEVCKTEINRNKRSRDDSKSALAESKRVHTEEEAVLNSHESNQVNSEPEVNRNSAEPDAGLGLYSPDVKQIREEILDVLDEPETVIDHLPEVQDLDSVIRSFEEEIVHPSTQPAQSDLGYLLEASDDELGLPPPVSASDYHVNAKTETPENAAGIGFENELPSFDSFEFGMNAGAGDGNSYGVYSSCDFMTLEGLFDYEESLEFSEFYRRGESLPALD